MTIQAVIFDLDGVITDTALYHFKAWKKLAEGLTISFNEEDNEQLKGLDRLTSLETILKKGKIECTEQEKNDLAREKNTYYLSLIEAMSPQDILPGAERVLKELREMNILIGLASASKNAHYVLKKLGLTHYFDYVADANEVKNSKPHPEVFLKVAEAFNASPENCMGVEDAVAGVQAINSALMHSVGIGDKHILKEADIVLNSLKEFNCQKLLKFFSESAKAYQ
ncbi:beta-phosphoglucomutase [Legionella impletisoli]|uniref:Beta-phosphoglucomutase n=1 Tax=Legionella impletisoli TaxID=343510 RepID=A0A917JNG2_9GAMM|nr:beta-phosphoglucomutase [Legionella impletisoli]GGI75492.1 beta-phosphoglucomutase [Legionella impletisoli]